MDPFQALAELPKMVADHQKTTAQLIEAQRELSALKEDKLVTWDWVCAYFGVTKNTAVAMLENEKVFCYGRQVKRFRKADIIRFAERHTIKVKDLPS
ncbi:helix-turn-helix domain-containing protein [Spirosoma utsteinense]|uniref:helix-turn-helix domain-containing protein n=1 Tax=Spirosoma utsteinense TaxID=2585773 RepID=UPI0016472C0B|nr:helix-turn-helix domain-containing protein [Spirosoma utsteinense]MBC3785748.1 hypothetical protein [Spirosoma utsteinense]